jgi:hypothetical protein
VRLRFLTALGLLTVGLACRGLMLTRFDHRSHLAERACGSEGQPTCLNCTSCHVGREGQHDSFAPPGVASCSGCHHDAEEKWKHALRPAIAALPAGKAIVFSHDQHLGQDELKGQCVKCHAGAVGFQSGPPLFPPMSTCLNCHRHQEQFEAGACFGCHRLSDLRTLKPSSFLPHDTAWMRRHGDEARASQARCALCHAQTQCDACHDATRRLGPAQLAPEKIDQSFVHRFDFVSRHALEAQSQPGSCFTCHARTECDACHASRGVSAAARGAVSPHPPGWASGLASNTHGPAARRDIASCAACHDQGPASNCVRCHKVGGFGGNPHPIGWRSTEPLSSMACAPCHAGGAGP